ncbi:MAG TPA: S24 family peptidase [Anaerolineales bacterium]|nr:S24 family peptidase [Anaerolineales bacterium]
MEDALKKKQSSHVWRIIEELEELSRTGDPRDRGEIMLRCAKTSCDLENLKEALRFCTEAENKYKTYAHSHAVVLWMIGCIHWAIGMQVKAIANWQETIEVFTTQQRNWGSGADKTAWYSIIVPELERYLEQAIDSEALPPYENPSSHENPGDPTPLKWADCEVHDEVPAGGFGPVGFEPSEYNLEISEVMIEGIPYKAYKLNFEKTNPPTDSILIRHGASYHTVRVKGNSMNDSKPVSIRDGDYVFVRAQRAAKNDEIVVIERREDLSPATVKRLQRNGNRLVLVPETTDESIKNLPEFQRDYSEQELNIVGVVEAVFKRKAD